MNRPPLRANQIVVVTKQSLEGGYVTILGRHDAMQQHSVIRPHSLVPQPAKVAREYLDRSEGHAQTRTGRT